MIEDKGKFKKYGNTKVITISSELACDSAFPFNLGDDVILSIVEGKLIIQKVGA